MVAYVMLRYVEDSEGIEVRAFPSDNHGGYYRMIVSRNGETICVCYARTLDDAQNLARLLVGIEIQPDGAAWKRGPRPPAQPTDKEGNL